jgi:nicotinate dehydrogenase subunit A
MTATSTDASFVTLRVNGRVHRVEVARETALLYVLRNDLALNGPKFGCGLGECGACAVLVGDVAARSCCIPVGAMEAREITTLEGLAVDGGPGRVQAAFIAEQAAQCGYCLNGMIMATEGLLRRNSAPTEDEIRGALSHNLCRCGTHIEILRAVRRAAADPGR